MAAGVIIAAGEAAAKGLSKWRYLPIITVLAVGLSLSGSRVALAATVVMLGFVAIRSGVRSMAAPVLATLVGVGLGWALDRSQRRWLERLGPNRRFGQPRFRTADRRVGIRARRVSASDGSPVGASVGSRPLFRASTHPSSSPRPLATDVGQPWFDAHNIFIGTLVAVGAIGFVLIWGVGRRSRRGVVPGRWRGGARRCSSRGCCNRLPCPPCRSRRSCSVPRRSNARSADASRRATLRSGVVAGSPCQRWRSGSSLGGLLVVNDVNLYRATEALDPQRVRAGRPVVAGRPGRRQSRRPGVGARHGRSDRSGIDRLVAPGGRAQSRPAVLVVAARHPTVVGRSARRGGRRRSTVRSNSSRRTISPASSRSSSPSS